MHASKSISDLPLTYSRHLCNNVSPILTQCNSFQIGFDGYLVALDHLKDASVTFHKQLLHTGSLLGAVSNDFQSFSSTWNVLDVLAHQAARLQEFTQDLHSHLTATLKPTRSSLCPRSRNIQESLKRCEKRRMSLVAEVQRSKEAYCRSAERAATMQSRLLEMSGDSAAKQQRAVRVALTEMDVAAQAHKANVDSLMAFLEEYNRDGPMALETAEATNRNIAETVRDSLGHWVGLSERLCSGLVSDFQALRDALAVMDVGTDASKFIATHAREPDPDPAHVHRFRMYAVAVPEAADIATSAAAPSPKPEPMPSPTNAPTRAPRAAGLRNFFRAPFARSASDTSQEPKKAAEEPPQLPQVPSVAESMDQNSSRTIDNLSFSEQFGPGYLDLDDLFQQYLLSLQYADLKNADEQVTAAQGSSSSTTCQALLRGADGEDLVPCPLLAGPTHPFCGAHRCPLCPRPKPRNTATCGGPACVQAYMATLDTDGNFFALPAAGEDGLRKHAGRMVFLRALRWQATQATCLRYESFEALRAALELALDRCGADRDIHAGAMLLQAAQQFTRESMGDPSTQDKDDDFLELAASPPSPSAGTATEDLTLAASLSRHPFCRDLTMWQEWFAFLLSADEPFTLDRKAWDHLVQQSQEDRLVHDTEKVRKHLVDFSKQMSTMGAEPATVEGVRSKLSMTYIPSD